MKAFQKWRLNGDPCDLHTRLAATWRGYPLSHTPVKAENVWRPKKRKAGEMASDQLWAHGSGCEVRASPVGTRHRKESFVQFRNHLLLSPPVTTATWSGQRSHHTAHLFPSHSGRDRAAGPRHPAQRGPLAGSRQRRLHPPTLRPWETNLAHLSLSFCICLMEEIIPPPGSRRCSSQLRPPEGASGRLCPLCNQGTGHMHPPSAASHPPAPNQLPSFLTKLSACGSHKSFLLLVFMRFSTSELLFQTPTPSGMTLNQKWTCRTPPKSIHKF